MALQKSAVRNPLSVNGTHLANVHSFKYIGSTVTDDYRMDKELDCRIQCATTSFGRLWDRLWSSHDISNKTKISVYNAAITSALLFGAETWTLYQRHFVRLRSVQQRHVRAILSHFTFRDHLHFFLGQSLTSSSNTVCFQSCQLSVCICSYLLGCCQSISV